MALTVFMSPLHVLPQTLDAPRYQDQIGNGVPVVRRKRIRGTSSWQLEIPGRQELLDPIWELLEYAQGDREIWFDGAGFGEVTSPAVIFIGDGSTADIMLPHKHVYVASFVAYLNDAMLDAAYWAPLGGDGVTMDSIICGPLPVGGQLKAKYRRKIKTLLRVEDQPKRSRIFRSASSATDNIHSLSLTLEEYLG